jgi:putative endonuclease
MLLPFARSRGRGTTARQVGSAGQPLMKLHYVYILKSEKAPSKFYIGRTEDLNSRLNEHNLGNVTYTSNLTPWKIKTYIAFTDEEKAVEFEKYLKSPSGRAFSKKRL